MITLTSLPSEIVDTILSYSDISFEDIINFRCVCKKFQWAARTKKYCFSKEKFSQRWHSAKKYYDEQFEENSEQQKSEENDEPKDKKHLNFIEKGIDCVRQLRDYGPKIKSLLNYNNIDLDERKRLREDLSEITSKTENYIKMLFFMDEIKHMLTQPLRAGCDLTEGYYNIKLFDYLRIRWRKVILNRYIEEQSHKELLEESAIALAQQLQLGKDVSYTSVKASLNTIALDALNFVRDKHYRHFILSTPDECFSRWKNNNIDDNFWTEEEGTQLMDVLEEYIFGQLKFQSVDSRELEYLCIDYVLENKCGHNLILLIIYESVARRLGLRCDVVITELFPYIQLFWVPRYIYIENDRRSCMHNLADEQNKRNMRFFSINFDRFPDCIQKKRYTAEIYKETFPEMLKSILRKESFMSICSDYTFSTDYDITTENEHTIRLRLREMPNLLPFSGVSHYNFTSAYKEIQSVIPERKEQKPRFAVGMIVTHGDKSTDCSTGVIIGWHKNNCSNHVNKLSRIFISWKRCNNFSKTEQQTHYLILTKSDQLCHVEEDVITLTEPKWIENRNIYRYFHKFEGTHYLPNEMLAKIYPFDAAIAAETIFQN